MKGMNYMANTCKKAASRILAVVVVLSLLTAVNAVSVLAEPADAAITVTNGAGAIYANNGATFVEAKLDVYVDAKAGVNYYILFAGYVDVFYNGANGANGIPGGSYYKPPFESGAWVATIPGKTAAAHRTELTAENNWKISVPKLKPGETYEIRIAAVKSGADTAVYGHRFIGSGIGFTAVIKGSDIVSTVAIHSKEASEASGTIYIAAYNKSGALAYLKTGDFKISENTAGTFTFTADIEDYKTGEYTFKAFCWGTNYAPLVPAIELK